MSLSESLGNMSLSQSLKTFPKDGDLEMSEGFFPSMDDDSAWLYCIAFCRVTSDDKDELITQPKLRLRRAFSRRAVANWEHSTDPDDVALWKRLESCTSMTKAEFLDVMFNKLVQQLEISGIRVGMRPNVEDDEVHVLLSIPSKESLYTIADSSDVILRVSDQAYHFKNIEIPVMGNSWSRTLFGWDKSDPCVAKQYSPFSILGMEGFRKQRDKVLAEAREIVDDAVEHGDAESHKGATHWLRVRSVMAIMLDDMRKALKQRNGHTLSATDSGAAGGLSEANINELLAISELTDVDVQKLSDTERSCTISVQKLLRLFTTFGELIEKGEKERSRHKVDVGGSPTAILRNRLSRWNRYSLSELQNAELYEDFSSQEVQQVLRSHLQSIFDVEAAKHEDIIWAAFPLHNRKEVELLADWGSMHPLKILSLPKDQQASKVRDYFGEQVAFFFSWLYFETRMLFIPVLISMAARLRFLPMFNCHDDSFEKIFGFLLVWWLSFTIAAFKQDSFKNNLAWGMTHPQVFGNKMGNFDPGLRGSRGETLMRWLHWFVVVVFVCGTAVSAFKINQIRAVAIRGRLHGEPQDLRVFGYALPVEDIAQYAIVVNIKVVAFAWKFISPKLANLENRRTTMSLADSQVVKNFIVMSMVTYYPFFYIAFIKRYVEGSCGPKMSEDESDMSGCISDLQSQVTMFFITNVFISFGMIAAGTAYHAYDVRQDLQKSKDAHAKYSDAEEQSNRDPYDGDMAEFLELTTELGFVVMFSGSLPIMSLVALITCLVKLRMIAWRLLHAQQRPSPSGREDIGQWRTVLQALSYISGVVALAMGVFVEGLNSGKSVLIPTTLVPGFGSNGKWFAFIGFEHVLLTAIFLFMQAIPPIAFSEMTCMEQQEEDLPRLLHFTDESHHTEVAKHKAAVIRPFEDGARMSPGVPPVSPRAVGIGNDESRKALLSTGTAK